MAEGDSETKLLQDVRQWLEGGGYVLEMRVAREVAKRTNIVWQSYTYVDPVTEKEREADVGAYVILCEWGEHLHGARLVIECKQTEAPWVVFQGHPGGNGGMSPFDCIDDHCEACVALEDGLSEIRRALPDGYAIKEKRSEKEAKNSGKDHAYEAVQQAVNVTLSGRLAAPEDLPVQGHPEPNVATGFTMPIVVTTSALVLARLNDAGEVELEPTSRASVLVARADLGDADGVDVIVVTEAELPALLDELCQIASDLTEGDSPPSPEEA